MSKTERVQAALSGQAIDRVPVSAWWHDWAREWSAPDLAAMTLEAYRLCDWDFIKVNPRFTYYPEGWGAQWQRYPDRFPQVTTKPVQSPDDLACIRAQDGTTAAWGEQIEALRQIAGALGGEAPFIQTVFTPLSVLPFLTGSPKYAMRLMAEHPDAFESAVDAVARTLVPYVRASLDAGAAGIFFATVDFGTADNISWAEYERFGKPYDLMVLEAAQGAPMNLMHVCRDNNHLPRMLDYPVAAFHWDVGGNANQTFAEVLSKTDKAVAGGVRVSTMQSGGYGDVMAEVNTAAAQTQGSRWLKAPACSVDPETPEATLLALTGVVHR